MPNNFYGDDGDNVNIGDAPEMYGGAGSDYLEVEASGAIYLEGGSGDDALILPDLDGSIGPLYGGDGADVIIGSGSGDIVDRLYGGAGDDIVWGDRFAPNSQFGRDLIFGDEGRDSLDGRRGNDTLYGGDSDDSGTDITAGVVGSLKTAPAGLFGGAGDDWRTAATATTSSTAAPRPTS